MRESAIVLDLSKGLGYGILYNPVIGQLTPTRYPLIARFRKPRFSRPVRK